MRQVIQSMRDGTTSLVEVPVPLESPASLLIRTNVTLISAGTEKMLVSFGRSSLLEKARSQPDRVRAVFDKVRTDGLFATLDAVSSKLDAPLPLGYCNVGTVIGVGAGCSGFEVGDRVLSNGAHAEIVTAAKNLCVRVPDHVGDDEAVFGVLGAIALQGLRLVQPTIGECVGVIGLGLIGLLTVQLLRANGCRVLTVDPDPAKSAMARRFGAEAVTEDANAALTAAAGLSRGPGLDAVLITAATESSEPVSLAARMCRKRGRIALVGVTGLELNRAEFYEKELSFQVSCSYGPGRYDPSYEEKGHDYPIGFVRWTEQRNFEAFIDLLAARKLDVGPLISHRFPFAEAPNAYELLVSGREPYLGILLEYGGDPHRSTTIENEHAVSSLRSAVTGDAGVGIIGAGNYCSRTLLPALAPLAVRRVAIASKSGVTAAHHARRFGFALAATDAAALIADPRIDVVMITTRHDSHARLVCEALRAGKHVFVEKPLALTDGEVDAIAAVHAGARGVLCVGFNRRFAPLVRRAKEALAKRVGPLAINITVNAGKLPDTHWTKDRSSGGGRVLGEGCHFIDLARHLVGSAIGSIQVLSAESPQIGRMEDIASIQLSFVDGSIAAIQYFANGHLRYPKERIDLFWDSKSLKIDNFRRSSGFGVAGKSAPFAAQNKGHRELLAAFLDAVRGAAAPPIPVEELFEVARWSIRASDMAYGRSAGA